MKYTATCVRSGDWWAITVPQIKGVFSQARRLDQVEGMAREAIALMLDVAPDSFEVDVQPDLPQEVSQARKARTALREAEQSADRATTAAARTLLARGYTVRDAGALLGISPQRVSQLVPTKRPRKVTAGPASGDADKGQKGGRAALKPDEEFVAA
ncbi:type II toxin-antitoxin system HicB family antitoxin [Micromonospora sp. MED01]|uniref:type II toxin-antitoxin system HicB family antitoxin n=1 Tax=Micromonospora alfalfae TaxID=2911212 RepID=UPI001EE8DC3C|nr:type II toxin-antitoxin system HicB family antitoxin [Micromonospora alfalfae]MCG5464312.1 type II toxin-antitoxin system HicB family antitoxin [Micromonospora alfalfae]